MCACVLQLAPWSTPHLRARLKTCFGVDTDPEIVNRDGIMELLLSQYALGGLRTVSR